MVVGGRAFGYIVKFHCVALIIQIPLSSPESEKYCAFRNSCPGSKKLRQRMLAYNIKLWLTGSFVSCQVLKGLNQDNCSENYNTCSIVVS